MKNLQFVSITIGVGGKLELNFKRGSLRSMVGYSRFLKASGVPTFRKTSSMCCSAVLIYSLESVTDNLICVTEIGTQKIMSIDLTQTSSTTRVHCVSSCDPNEFSVSLIAT